MNYRRMIILSNRLATWLVFILIYWVFIFTCIEVFGFKIFAENLSQLFGMSILGIIALLSGSLILSIILNLTRISETLAASGAAIPAGSNTGIRKWRAVAMIISFPLIFVFLYFGDYRSAQLKRKRLFSAAQEIATENPEIIEHFGNYTFDAAYLSSAAAELEILAKQEKLFAQVSLIVEDKISNKTFPFEINQFIYPSTDVSGNKTFDKAKLIFSCSAQERAYLHDVFSGRRSDYRFIAHDGTYELFYPMATRNRVIVLYFTNHSTYGKLGS